MEVNNSILYLIITVTGYIIPFLKMIFSKKRVSKVKLRNNGFFTRTKVGRILRALPVLSIILWSIFLYCQRDYLLSAAVLIIGLQAGYILFCKSFKVSLAKELTVLYGEHSSNKGTLSSNRMADTIGTSDSEFSINVNGYGESKVSSGFSIEFRYKTFKKIRSFCFKFKKTNNNLSNDTKDKLETPRKNNSNETKVVSKIEVGHDKGFKNTETSIEDKLNDIQVKKCEELKINLKDDL